mmetsp:Transcript_51540/g.110468  ORF Transcript_51540/g.110468 Transcript_51540/m.110468 type:complete len:86 (+) Transcript_51540:1233-1490(+)
MRHIEQAWLRILMMPCRKLDCWTLRQWRRQKPGQFDMMFKLEEAVSGTHCVARVVPCHLYGDTTVAGGQEVAHCPPIARRPSPNE